MESWIPETVFLQTKYNEALKQWRHTENREEGMEMRDMSELESKGLIHEREWSP